MEELSANKRWRQSGTTLSFKDWITREKEKFANADGQPDLILNIPLQDSVKQALIDARKSAGFKTEESNKTVLGLNKTVVIIAGVLLVSAIAWKIYKNRSHE